MKAPHYLARRLPWLAALAFFGCVGTVLAQDAAESGKIRLKIIKEVDGKTTITDTTYLKGSPEYEAFCKRMADFSPMGERIPVSVCLKTRAKEGTTGAGTERRIITGDSTRIRMFRTVAPGDDSAKELLERLEKEPGARTFRIEGDKLENLETVQIRQLAPPAELDKLLKEQGLEPGRVFISCEKTAAGEGKPFRFFCDTTVFKTDASQMQFFRSEDGEGHTFVLVRVAKLEKAEADLLEQTNENLPVEKKPLEVQDFSLFPNPSSGRFMLSFELEDKGTTSIRIFDEAGRQVYTEELRSFKGAYSKEIDLSGSPKGVYFVRVDQGKKGFSRKIVLQ